MLDALGQSRGDRGRTLEVHIGHTQTRDQMIDMLLAHRAVPFHVVEADAIIGFVEVVTAAFGRGLDLAAGGKARRQGA